LQQPPPIPAPPASAAAAADRQLKPIEIIMVCEAGPDFDR